MPHSAKNTRQGFVTRESDETIDQSWRLKAKCRDVNRDMFFPEDSPGFLVKDEPGNPGYYCFNCVVRRECLNYALSIQSTDGIFGGVNERQRARMIHDQVMLKRRIARTVRQRLKGIGR
jgi:WhiB family transcriptional regulator, redox-sensing transcriptional regulator